MHKHYFFNNFTAQMLMFYKIQTKNRKISYNQNL